MPHRQRRSDIPLRTNLQRANAPSQRRSSGQPFWLLEGLENRTLMAVSTGGAFDVRNIPAFHPTTANVRDLQNGPISNLGTSLANLYLEYRSYQRRGGNIASFHSQQSDFLAVKGAYVGVQIRTAETLSTFTRTLRRYGLVVTGTNTTYGVVEGVLPITALSDVGQLAGLAIINPIYAAKMKAQGQIDNQQNSVPSPGGNTAADVRNTLGVTGDGVSVGVISDSFDRYGNGESGSVGSGDLPDDVTVLKEGEAGATDEGRAMLELIYDVAPDAKLLFASYGGSELSFADSINRLSEAGTDIMVDDIGLPDEPQYQPGVIDVAINDYVAKGGLYFSAAGNTNNQSHDYLAQYYTDRKGSTYVDFDPSSNVDTQMQITVGNGTYMVQWSDPYNGVAGQAKTDFSVRLYDVDRNLVQVIDENNFRNGKPLEMLHFGAPADLLTAGTYFIEVAVNSTARRQSLPQRIGIFTNGALSTEFSDPTIDKPGLLGHAANENAFSVGAVSFTQAPPNGSAVSESFSSAGKANFLYNADGTPNVRTRSVPDFSAVDNVNTSFFSFGNDSLDDIPEDPDQYGNFSGTSAAAPNAAAIVALMLQANPALTRDEVLSVIRDNALDINGTPGGTYDALGGFGLINAFDSTADTIQPPQADIVNPPSILYAPLAEVNIKFTHGVDQNSLQASDFTLTRDGFVVPLTGAFVTQDTATTAVLTGLAPLTSADGTYVLRLNATTSGVVDLAPTPNPLSGDAVATWVKATLIRPTIPQDVTATAIASDAIRVRFTDTTVGGGAAQSFVVRRADDINFTKNVKTFTVIGANSFLDQPLTASRFYYYRVFGVNDAGRSGSSTIVYTATLSPGEQILDNEGDDVTIRGNWVTRNNTPGAFDASYLDDLNTGKGTNSVTYTPTLTGAGDYYVYARWTKDVDRATNVPYTITYGKNAEKTTTIYVDQRNTGGGGFVLLGKFNFVRGTVPTVTITTKGTNGTVIADAIRFQPVS